MLEEHDSAEGTVLPRGSFRIARDDHRRAVAAVHAADWQFDVAHPMYGHLATHSGMGWSLEEFLAFFGAGLDSGVMFGESDLTYLQPIQLDVPYAVDAHIESVVRKTGRQTGVFDLITVHLELIDPDGTTVVISKETYVLPDQQEELA